MSIVRIRVRKLPPIFFFSFYQLGFLILEMNKSTTDTTRTDACPYCGAAKLTGMIAKKAWECWNANTFERSRSELCREREARQKAEAEVERLKKMVIEAAELGDKRSENFKARAEKAEASLIKINQELCQAGLREYGN